MWQKVMEFRDGSGIGRTIYKQSEPRSKQVTMPTLYHSVIMARCSPRRQTQPTASNHWKHRFTRKHCCQIIVCSQHGFQDSPRASIMQASLVNASLAITFWNTWRDTTPSPARQISKTCATLLLACNKQWHTRDDSLELVTCDIRHIPSTALATTWKLFFSHCTGAQTALKAL